MEKLSFLALAFLISWTCVGEAASHLPLPPSKQPLSAALIAKLYALPVETVKPVRPRRVSFLLTTLNVTVNTDNNPGGFGEVGDLRYVINSMNQDLNSTADDYAIAFASPMTIQLNGNLPIINSSANPVNITIGNTGSTATVTIDGNNAYSGFFIPTGNVTIQNINFQNLLAKGGNGGDGISGGGGGLGAGAAIYAPQIFLNGSNPSITLMNVTIQNSSAVGGNGGSYTTSANTGNEGGGGGGGFGGNGGSITTTGSTGGGGGGGFGGNGGAVTLSFDLSGGGGGGGGGIGSRATIGTLANLGHGGSDQTAGLDGSGYGLSITAGSGGGGNSGGSNAGGGGGGGSVTQPGGGGGGSAGANGTSAQGNTPPFVSPNGHVRNGSNSPSGGSGADGAGGGGAGIVSTNISNSIDGEAGAGGYGGGGGGGAGTGAYDVDYAVTGGNGGLGGGGGGGGVNQSGMTDATGGNSNGGGGGAGGGPSNGPTSQGGSDIGNLGGGSGGAGANTYGSGFGGGGGGGGSGLGGAIFVDSNLNFTLQALSGIPTTFETLNNTTQAGSHGTGAPGASDGVDGTALGNSIFLRTSSTLTLQAQDSGDLLTLGSQVAVVDDTSFGAGGTNVFVKGNGTVVYNGTSDYQGTVLINNANLKVNGQISQASVYVCRNSSFSSQRGTLSGNGTLTGSVFANSGTVSPGASGTLTVGSLTLSPADITNSTLGSAVGIDINSVGTSLVAVTGAASLAGVLQVNIASGATGGTYTVLTSSGLTGTFDSVTFTGLTPSSYTISYLPIGAPTYVQIQFSAGGASPVTTGSGTLAGSNGPVQYKLRATKNANNQIVASMSFNDPGTGMHFDNPVVTSFSVSGGQATIGGTARVLGTHPQPSVTFTTTINGGTPGTFSMTMGNGYSVSGNLTSGGNIVQ